MQLLLLYPMFPIIKRYVSVLFQRYMWKIPFTYTTSKSGDETGTTHVHWLEDTSTSKLIHCLIFTIDCRVCESVIELGCI